MHDFSLAGWFALGSYYLSTMSNDTQDANSKKDNSFLAKFKQTDIYNRLYKNPIANWLISSYATQIVVDFTYYGIPSSLLSNKAAANSICAIAATTLIPNIHKCYNDFDQIKKDIGQHPVLQAMQDDQWMKKTLQVIVPDVNEPEPPCPFVAAGPIS